MGSDVHYEEEAPARQVKVDGFFIDKTPVTNRQFKEFVKATGHVTLAERVPDAKDYPGALPHMLYTGSLVFQKASGDIDLRNPSEWWDFIRGASWKRPLGPKSGLFKKENHPVVHVAYEDALAYARWVGKELPTEAEWEYAAWGGAEDAEYAWGNEFAPGGKQMANTWQGEFPYQNLLDDGFERTSPVGIFPANGLRAAVREGYRHDGLLMGTEPVERWLFDPSPRQGRVSAILSRFHCVEGRPLLRN